MRTVSETAPSRSSADVHPVTVPLATVEQILGLTAIVARERYARLTERELQVAIMIATDKRNNEIAAELGIGTKTIDIHRAHIKSKLGADTIAQIANLVNLVRLADTVDGVAATR